MWGFARHVISGLGNRNKNFTIGDTMAYNIQTKNLKRFIKYLAKLDPIEFMGVATLLNVKVYDAKELEDQEVTARVLSEMIDRFCGASLVFQTDIVALLKAAVKGKK